MKHNIFDQEEELDNDDYLSHADMEIIISDAKRFGSLREHVISWN